MHSTRIIHYFSSSSSLKCYSFGGMTRFGMGFGQFRLLRTIEYKYFALPRILEYHHPANDAKFLKCVCTREKSTLIQASSQPSFQKKSLPKAASNTNLDDFREEDWKILYEREGRTLFPRGLLAFTTVHSIYWAWYVFDFVPALNASTLALESGEEIDKIPLVDPMIGHVGLGLAVLMFIGAVVYPQYLVSAIRENSSADVLRINTFQLPFVTVPTNGGAVYHKSDVNIENSIDAKTIIERHQGDLSKFRGHIGLVANGLSANLLLHFTDNAAHEVKNNNQLLNSLLKDAIVPRISKIQRDKDETRRVGNKSLQRIKRMHRKMKKVHHPPR